MKPKALIPYSRKRSFMVNGLELAGKWGTFEEAVERAGRVVRRLVSQTALMPNQRVFIYEFDVDDVIVKTHAFAVGSRGEMVLQ